MYIRTTIISAAIFMTGCSSLRVNTPTAPPIDKELMSLAMKSENNLKKLSSIRDAKAGSLSDNQKKQHFFQTTVVPEGLDKKATFSYIGDAEKATKSLIELGGYKFKTSGVKPKIPILVNINAEDELLIDILRTVASQTGARARLELHPAAKVGELNYGK